MLLSNKRKLLIALSVFLVATFAGWLTAKYYFTYTEKKVSPLIELKDGSLKKADRSGISEENLTVTIFLPSGDAITTEKRTIKYKTLAVEIAEEVLKEYIKGLKEGLNNTKLNGVYRDSNNVIYVDLSDEFRRGFSGDVRHEYALLKSLYETVTKNVPETEDVRLLIDGKEIETIGGHFYSLYGLKTIAND